MTLMLIPDIENIVLVSCQDLISQYNFSLYKKLKNEVYLLSEKCAIKIMAGVSPIGERQIDIDFYDPQSQDSKKKYYSDTFLLYLHTRQEPRDILRACGAERETFEETLSESLKCFTAHTLKYRKDILSGDFSSWLPEKYLE